MLNFRDNIITPSELPHGFMQRVDEYENVNWRQNHQDVDDNFGDMIVVLDSLEDVPFEWEEAFGLLRFTLSEVDFVN